MGVPALLRRNYFRNGRCRVVLWREPHQRPIAQHRHEFMELAVILSGEGVHVTGRFQHRVQAGDVLVISRQRPHGYERTKGLNLLNILIRDDVLPRLARDLRFLPGFHALFALEAMRWNQRAYASHLRLTADDLAQISDWADRLEQESRQPAQGGYVLAEAYLVLITGLLVRRYGGSSPHEHRPETGLGKLLSWIESHLSEDINVPLLARRAGMSVRSFHRHFRTATGATPLAYILRQRLARARELLDGNPTMRMDEISAECGFGDANYFSRVFSRACGVAPREFRKQALVGSLRAARKRNN